MRNASKHLSRCRSGAIVALVVLLWACPAFARSKNRSSIHQSVAPLEMALATNDLVAAQAIATSIYQEATKAPALQSFDPTVIIDPALAARTVEFTRTKAAFEIAQSFYNHAQLDSAKQWATTAATGGTMSEEYVRRATVLLGNVATAMDKGDDAMAHYLSVIALHNLYREQPAAYAGVLELLMLQKQDDLVEQWVRHGQNKFEGSGGLELEFLKAAAKTLKRRNHPLWNELDQQIVALAPAGKGGKLPALRELASNARKLGRYAEAETHYAAICAMPLSAEDIVNSHLFLAECQQKQGKDYAAGIRNLESRIRYFATVEQKDYGHYRLAKFYQGQGRDDLAQAKYSILISSGSTSAWAAAALHQLGVLKEKHGDLQGALQLYLQYPQRFTKDQRLTVQSYASALNVAMALGDTNTAGQIVGKVANSTAAIQDYKLQLQLAWYCFHRQANKPLALSSLERGLVLAQRALGVATEPQQRYAVHYQVLRRLCDFGQYQRMLDYVDANASDFPATVSGRDKNQLQSYCYEAMALNALGHHQEAVTLLGELLDQVQGNTDLEMEVMEDMGLFYSWSNDSASAAQLFALATQTHPSHPWASIGRLELAVQAFNGKDYAGAQKLADDIINALPENSDRTWIRERHWDAVYLSGCCLDAQGQTQEGAKLKQLAMSKFPALNIQDRLHGQEAR